MIFQLGTKKWMVIRSQNVKKTHSLTMGEGTKPKIGNLTGTGLMEQERLMEMHKQGAIRHCLCENHKI